MTGKLVTSTGAELEETDLTKSAVLYAKNRGLSLRCFLATLPSGERQYILVDSEGPFYASHRYEDICVHIDILHLSESPDDR